MPHFISGMTYTRTLTLLFQTSPLCLPLYGSASTSPNCGCIHTLPLALIATAIATHIKQITNISRKMFFIIEQLF
jgi:hypothetical protein